ncbi:MAG TPA: DUF4326 domain-containing protein [Rhizomicrobium sp.]|nr:DUF4326 domain-containing protein [Rhizomicrobium sp.]
MAKRNHEPPRTVRPVRLRLSRRKGYNLQALSHATNGLEAVKVTRPGIFSNPYVIGRDGDRDYCVHRFRDELENGLRDPLGASSHMHRLVENLGRIRGRNLACWCWPDQLCHADVLLEVANRSHADTVSR